MPSFAPLPTPLSRRARRAGGEPLASLLMARSLARPELISLAAGFVDHGSLPVEATEIALWALWKKVPSAHASLQYGGTLGYPPLRQAILDRLSRVDGGQARRSVGIEQVVITAGSNSFLHLLSDTLCDPGDIVLCGAPSYYVYLDGLASLDIRAVGVATDALGIVPESLDDRLAMLARQGELGRVRAVYVTSYFDNPTGSTLAAERRRQVVEIARRWSQTSRIYTIEDAAYRELRYDAQADLPSIYSLDDEGDAVVYVGSFSKSFSPGLRIGWAIVPRELIGAVVAQKGNIDFGSPNFNQVLMATVLEQGLFDRHVSGLRQLYQQKMAAADAAASAHLARWGARWNLAQGGLYLWLRLPPEIDCGIDSRLFAHALEEGVLYVPGGRCYPPEGCQGAANTIRLAIGVPDEPAIGRGIAALRRALARERTP